MLSCSNKVSRPSSLHHVRQLRDRLPLTAAWLSALAGNSEHCTSLNSEQTRVVAQMPIIAIISRILGVNEPAYTIPVHHGTTGAPETCTMKPIRTPKSTLSTSPLHSGQMRLFAPCRQTCGETRCPRSNSLFSQGGHE